MTPALARLGRRRRVSPRRLAAVSVVLGVGTLVARRLGYGVGGRTIVRCRRGHLFTTLWIPGVNLTKLDLVVARVQRCPVGRHWSLVVPVRAATLSENERRAARTRHDLLVP
jgi:hypothetical protein